MNLRIFSKFFLALLGFFLALLGLVLLLVYEGSTAESWPALIALPAKAFLGWTNALAVFVLVVCTGLIFAYLFSQRYLSRLRYLNKKAVDIFEGRYEFSLPASDNGDELAELSFWLDKIAQGIKTQKELLQHEAEALMKRDWRLLETSNALKAERDKIKILIENIDEGLILLGRHGEILLTNPWAEKVLGADGKQLLGKKLVKLPLNEKIVQIYQRVLARQRPEQKQISNLRPGAQNSVRRYFLVSIFPVIFGSQTENSFVIISLRDITREKIISQMKSEFISIAAHQLRTPLSAIKWIFHMLLSGDLGKINKNQKEFLTKGCAANEKMIVLINDLLNVTRIEEGQFLFEFAPISLKETIKEVLAEFIPLAAKREIGLDFICPKIPLPLISADRSKLRLALQNLLDNAIKYTPPRKSVTVTLKKELNGFKILIKDRGVGIPQDQWPRVFSKFFRGTNVLKMETDGTGLGLFITRNIIKKHGGNITFTSQENRGTEFIIDLPLKK